MKKAHIIIIHLLFWVTFVIIPFFMFNFGSPKMTPERWYFFVYHIFNAIVFYLVYFLILPVILRRNRIGRAIFYGISFIVFVSVLRLFINPSIKEAFGAFEKFPLSLSKQVGYSFFWTAAFSLYAVIIYLSIEWFRERSHRYKLASEKQTSEINLLKSQVNPHFLMNTLNNLYSLVYTGSDRASEAILKLSDIMRYMLYDTNVEKVPLVNEIKYLQSFIELQMLRFTNKELVELEITGEPDGRMIAPMLLVPFVENAFKHGNKNLPGMGISISMDITDSRLKFEVNNIKASKMINKAPESGIGLANIQKRLELQYPGKHDLLITEGIDYYNILLTVEL